MKNRDIAVPVGVFELTSYDAFGKLVERRSVRNKIVDVGLSWMAGALSGDVASPATMKYLAIGTGTTAAAAGQTALVTPVESRTAGTQTRINTNTGSSYDTYQCVGTITMTADRAVTEIGIFSASSSGTLLCRQVFAVMNIPNGGSLAVTYKVIFTSVS